MSNATLAGHWFSIEESGDDTNPWMIWDRDEECPLEVYPSRLDAEMAMVRLGWSVGEKLAGRDAQWPK